MASFGVSTRPRQYDRSLPATAGPDFAELPERNVQQPSPSTLGIGGKSTMPSSTPAKGAAFPVLPPSPENGWQQGERKWHTSPREAGPPQAETPWSSPAR